MKKCNAPNKAHSVSPLSNAESLSLTMRIAAPFAHKIDIFLLNSSVFLM